MHMFPASSTCSTASIGSSSSPAGFTRPSAFHASASTSRPRASRHVCLAAMQQCSTEQLRNTKLITAIKTPYELDGRIDLPAFDRHVDHQVRPRADCELIQTCSLRLIRVVDVTLPAACMRSSCPRFGAGWRLSHATPEQGTHGPKLLLSVATHTQYLQQ